MSDSVTTTVEVAVAPEVAFDVFTREIDAWYQVDKDTLPDITRMAAIRFEPCAGGRLLDVHDTATGEGRELGRITRWEPGRRLAFTDNEGTEVDVVFERSNTGTRVTLTHRGLNRLAPKRAAQLRHAGWAGLAPFYRDHVVPNARPTGLAFVSGGLIFAALGGGTWIVSGLARDERAASTAIWIAWGLLACAGLIAWFDAEDRMVRRWLRSRWQYHRIQSLLWALVLPGLLVFNLRATLEDGADPLEAIGVIGVPALILMSFLLNATAGPVEWRNERTRAASVHRAPRSAPGHAIRSFLSRHRSFGLFLFVVGVAALGFGLREISPGALDLMLLALISVLVVAYLQMALKRRERRRHKRALGYDPDYYLSVDRRVSEQGCRPEVLVHQPSRHPEFSGWWAYAGDRAHRKEDFVTWSVGDLVDHAPEAALPLRQGHGTWRWNDSENAYQPL